MAEDQTYQGEVRRLQDGDKLEIASSGALDNYGEIKNIGVGYNRFQSESVVGLSTSSTGEVILSAAGLSQLTTTGTTGARALFRLPKPLAIGQEKMIYATNATTGATAVISTTAAGIQIGVGNSTSHGNYHTMTMNDSEDSVRLIGLSATAWGILSNVGSVALTTPVG